MIAEEATGADQQALLDACTANIRVASAQVSRRYRNVTTYADLYQDAVAWVLLHPGTAQGRLDDGRRGSRRLTNQIAGHLDGISRRLKAACAGYQVEDEAFYSRAMVEAVLPAVWDSNYAARPPAGDGDQVKQHADPSEQGTWLAMVIDVRKAWDTSDMDGRWRDALVLRFRDGLRIYQVAAHLQVADSTAHAYLGKGVRSLIKQLGGPRPARCLPGCECEVVVGTRRVKSNAGAASETARCYG